MRSSREPLIPLNTAKLLFFFHIPLNRSYFFASILLKYGVFTQKSIAGKRLAIFSPSRPQ